MNAYLSLQVLDLDVVAVDALAFHQQLAFVKGKQDDRVRRINASQVIAVKLGAHLVSCALFVEPEDLMIARNDQPAVE